MKMGSIGLRLHTPTYGQVQPQPWTLPRQIYPFQRPLLLLSPQLHFLHPIHLLHYPVPTHHPIHPWDREDYQILVSLHCLRTTTKK
jgi:hypothetical protein